VVNGQPYSIQVAAPLNEFYEALERFGLILLLSAPLLLIGASLGGYWISSRALKPVDEISAAAESISIRNLSDRLQVPKTSDELQRLSETLNRMLGRLNSSVQRMSQFTADASHELRTPLAVVRGIGEAAVAERRSPAEYEEAIGSMLEEVDRMTNLVDTLLRLSHADAGAIRLSRQPVDLGQLARDVAASLALLAEERDQKLTFDTAPGVFVPVDRLVLPEAVTNVLDNAIKYSPARSTVALHVRRVGDQALLAIGDDGPGIPPEYRERIFHRFFRVDEARSRDHGGAGLGLAIAKWAVDMHGGQITVEQRPGGGSEFRILLPLASSVEITDEQNTTQLRMGG